MLNIQLIQMKYALEVARTGSISQAARNLYMNQPNLSRSIKELESAAGTQLFIRTPKGMIPTRAGQLFLDTAGEILQKLDLLEEQLSGCQKNLASLTISIPRATYITYAFSEFLKNIQETPEISINYRETNREEAIDNILHLGFDLAIIRFTEPYETEFLESLARKNLSSRDVWESDYLLLMSETHPLAGKKEILRKDLKQYTELVHGDEDYHKTNPHENISKRISLYERGSQFDFLRNVPGTYMWVSPLPEKILKDNGLVQRKCADSSIRFKDVLVFHSNYTFPSYTRKFLGTLSSVIKEIKEKPDAGNF